MTSTPSKITTPTMMPCTVLLWYQASELRQQFLYLRPLPHGQGSLRPGSLAISLARLCDTRKRCGLYGALPRKLRQELPASIPAFGYVSAVSISARSVSS